MTHYTSLFMQENDLDVFFRFRNFPIHVATYGSKIPDLLNDKDKQIKLFIEIMSKDSLEDNEVHINEEFLMRHKIRDSYNVLRQRINHIVEQLMEHGDLDIYNQNYELSLYCNSFSHFAQRGFYSFNYSPKDSSFFLVAWPTVCSDIELPELVLNNVGYIDFDNPQSLIDVHFFAE